MDDSFTDRRKWRQIIDGARKVFLEQGFDGASVGDIVRVAGVSKGTLYAYFPSKEKLFETLIFEDRRRQAEQLFSIEMGNDDVRAELTALGRRFLSKVLSAEALSHARTVIAASARFPDIGRAYFEAGPHYGAQKLAAYLEVQTEQGALCVEHYERAAWQFLDLCKSQLHLRQILAAQDIFPDEQIEANVAEAVDMFLGRYTAKAAA